MREAIRTGARHAAVRRPAHRRDRPQRRRDRRDEDRRGQDPRRGHAHVPQRAGRQGGPPRHGQRLPGQAATASGWVASTASWAGGRNHPGPHDPDERRAAYKADVTYGTNTEFGFDYLRDNMVVRLGECVQRGHTYCDRRRGRLDPHRRGAHPGYHLGRPETSADTYRQFAQVMPRLDRISTTRSTRAAHGGGTETGVARSRRRSTSTTSTKTPTAPWSTIWCRRCAPRRSTTTTTSTSSTPERRRRNS